VVSLLQPLVVAPQLVVSATLKVMLPYDSNEFRATNTWPYAIAAGCIVYREVDNTIELLLLYRDYDHDAYSAGDTNKPSYHLPKGHLKFNESLEDCARRETREEIGAEVAIEGYLGSLHHDFNHPTHRNTTDKVIHYFVAKWVSDTKKTDNEHDGRVWVPIKSAVSLLGKPNPKQEDEIVKRLQHFLEISNAT